VSSAPERRPGPARRRAGSATLQRPGGADPPLNLVGVIGAGRIGQPIIRNLVRKGFVVVANDVDGSKQEAVEKQGGRWAELAELARDAGAILICVGYDRDLRALMDEGLINKVSAGAIVVVLSTVQPRTVQELEEIARYKGVAVVDATMCRGGRAADAGTMLSFIAGDPAVIERLKPVVSAYSTDIVYTGAVGTAQVAKAANNLLMWACLIANHEALALAQRFGVDVELLRAALLKTGADNGVLRNWGTSTMAWADDDLEIIQSMAEDAGIALPQAELNRELCRMLKPKKFRLDEYGV
jgi:3-hydroxyisobutyrate dehydrogenase